jgi:hypothetical protein
MFLRHPWRKKLKRESAIMYKHKKQLTITIFFDLEFYVPILDRSEQKELHANPYKDGHFLIGGTFLVYYPLDKNHDLDKRKYWIWNYANEKDMLKDIVKLFNESWEINKSDVDQSELVVCGIGIGRVDIAYLFGRCVQNSIESKDVLFSIFNHLRVIDLENTAIPFFKSKCEMLYPKTTSEINSKFLIEGKREPGSSIWDYYDNKEYDKIIERNEKEIDDQLKVYTKIVKSNLIKSIPPKYSSKSMNIILSGLKDSRDIERIKCYYQFSQEDDKYILLNEITEDDKYEIFLIIKKSKYWINE